MLQVNSSPRSYAFLFIMWSGSWVTKRWIVANITSLASIYIRDNYAKKSQYSSVPLSIPSLPNLNKEKAVLTKVKLPHQSKSHPHSGMVYQHIIQDGLKHLHSHQYKEVWILVWTFSVIFITAQFFHSEAIQQQWRHRMAKYNILKIHLQNWS